jgi:hypothetical protein
MIVAFDPVHGGFGASSTGATGEGFGWGAKVLEEPEGKGDDDGDIEEDLCEGERGEVSKSTKRLLSNVR